MKPRALFVVSQAGLGHLNRCRALACELVERGWSASLSTSFQGTAHSYDVAIIDGYDFPRDLYTGIGVRLMVIEDRPNHLHPYADLLVNGTVGAIYPPRPPHVPAARRMLFGPQYAILRREFREIDRGDYHPLTRVEDLRLLSDMTAAQVAQTILRAEVVVARASMVSLEAACLGRAIVLTPADEGDGTILNEVGLVNCGAAVYAEQDADVEGIVDALIESNSLAGMASMGRTMVDGLGAKRVADMMETLWA